MKQKGSLILLVEFSCDSCTEMPEGDKDKQHEQHGTLLRALVSAMKVSFITNEGIQVPHSLFLYLSWS